MPVFVVSQTVIYGIYVISIVLRLMVALFCIRAYFIARVKGLLGFSAGFFLIAAGVTVGLLASISNPGAVEVPLAQNAPSLLLYVGMGIVLSGFMTLFITAEKIQSRRIMFFLYSLVVLGVLVARQYSIIYYILIFSINAAVLLYFYRSWRRKPTPTRSLWCASWACGTATSVLAIVSNAGFPLASVISVFINIAGILFFMLALYRIMTATRRLEKEARTLKRVARAAKR